MYVAESRWSRGESSLEAGLYLVPGARLQTIVSRGLAMDTRFLAAAETPADTVNLFLLHEGSVGIGLDEAATVAGHAPCWWVASRDEFELRRGPAASFSLRGEPRRSVEICLAVDRLHVPPGLRHGLRASSSALTASVAALFDRASSHRAQRVDRCRDLFRALSAEGICTLPTELDEGAHERSIQRILDSFDPLYQRHQTSAYAQLLAGLAGMSLRQTTRDVAAMTQLFRLPGNNLRELLRVLRLRRATMLLSAPGLSLEDVASEIGYGSLTALGRAFRDAGLPPPRDIRVALQSPA